jgi:ATP-dependent Clp protease ATP-binding subunit ClpA
MGDRQLQELAIRLADTAVAILKAKSSRTKRLEITKTAMERQMTKSGQRPYDDDILSLAVDAIGASLDYYYEDFVAVIWGRLWSEPTDMFSTG